MADRLPPTHADLVRWSEALAGIARTGLGFTESLYERERFEEVLHIAGDMRAALAADDELDVEDYVDEWMRSVGQGVAGYVTPKAAVGAVVHDDDGRILLVQRADTGVWLYPTGWADVGYSASEVAVKEVLEETGITACAWGSPGSRSTRSSSCAAPRAVTSRPIRSRRPTSAGSPRGSCRP
jgi:hypothetical protein